MALIAVTVALAVPAPAVSHPHDLEVEWLEAPSAGVMGRHYPSAARTSGVSGWAVILCRLTKTGRVRKCRTAAEGPEGYGFGQATVAASKSFRMKTSTPDGRSAEGEVIAIPVQWGPSVDVPPRNYRPGEPALMTAIAPGSALLYRTAPCPPPDMERRCPTFQWARRPDVEDLEEMIRQAGDAPSLMLCTIAETGLLRDCQVAGAPPALAAELLKSAESFEAPPLTPDRMPTMDKRVALTFDWRAMRRYLDARNAVQNSR